MAADSRGSAAFFATGRVVRHWIAGGVIAFWRMELRSRALQNLTNEQLLTYLRDDALTPRASAPGRQVTGSSRQPFQVFVWR
jgi:hypothetical protein